LSILDVNIGGYKLGLTCINKFKSNWSELKKLVFLQSKSKTSYLYEKGAIGMVFRWKLFHRRLEIHVDKSMNKVVHSSRKVLFDQNNTS